jgi:hypothetical protein
MLIFLFLIIAFLSSNSEAYHRVAFLVLAPSTTSRSSSLSLSTTGDGTISSSDGTIDRRGLLTRCASTATILGASTVALRPSIARATAAATVAPSTSNASNTNALLLCDPSVSTWIRTYDDDSSSSARRRTVHIIGTAHISSSSAELAGHLVKELKPDVVFVELDAKRVSRAIPASKSGVRGSIVPGGGDRNDRDSGGPVNYSSEKLDNDSAPPLMASVVSSTPSDVSSNNTDRRTKNPFDIQSRLVDAGSKVVGDSVKSMYTKLESEGYKAGDEFATSVREGLAIGATIVLGDRDVEVTLRRLTRALTKTDISKLLSPDSDIERSMEGLLPEGMKKSLESANGGRGGNPIGDESMTSGVGALVSKQDLNSFVETMKAKDNIKKIMSALRTTAPEIYDAMVAERDVYMGQGLDELTLVGGRSVNRTVAVVGMAHVDGIERYLASKGWTEMRYTCPIMR